MATNLFFTDPETAKNAEAWSKIRESRKLLKELLHSLVSSKRQLGEVNNGTSDETDRLHVTALRYQVRAEIVLCLLIVYDRYIYYIQYVGPTILYVRRLKVLTCPWWYHY